MKSILFTLLIFTCLHLHAQVPEEIYPVDSASVEHKNVPKGELIKCSFGNSKIFPGTSRDYWIYIPARYSPDKPACLYLNQDGIQMKAPTVFDNLIDKKEMPVTIGVFVMPGVEPAADSMTTLDRHNRSFEYDGLGTSYGRFILDELLPDVEKHKTREKKPIRISKNPNDRAAGGASTGAICDGILINKQRYGWLHTPDDHDNAWPDGLKCDREGRIYVATNMGIQVLDQTGRVNAILKIPSGNVSNCCFGGPDFNVLYITCGDKVYKRKLKVKGFNTFDSPFKIVNPKF